MPRTINISVPSILLLSALFLSACASNSEPDAVTPSRVNATQPDNNFGGNSDTEKTATTNTTPASATDTTSSQSPASKKKKAVKKTRKAVKKPEPTQ
jgi:hypothetical protein